MTAHRKGSTWRRSVASWFTEQGLHVESRGIGYAGDDLTVTGLSRELSVEVKNHARIDLSTFLDQAVGNARPDQVPVLIVKRRGRAGVDDSYVVLPGRDFRRLIGDLT